MSVKIYDKIQKKWVIFPGTIGAPGKDAYLIAQENGYTGTREEYAQSVIDIPKITNLVNEIKIIDIPNQIKASIIDNLEYSGIDKSLSANQGRILKEMIANLANLQIEVVNNLPNTGEPNIIYLVKNQEEQEGSESNIYDEYLFVNNEWEKIGDTKIDLTNYYTISEVDNKIDNMEILWTKIKNKPEKYTPSEHTHSLQDITDAGKLASKDLVDIDDLAFNLPDIKVDSSLDINSTNPVQNKVITEALNNQLPTLTNSDDAGKPGIFFTMDTTQINIVPRVTKEHPDAIVIVPGSTPVVFEEPTTYNMQGIDHLMESVEGSYKCFCITWVAAAGGALREDLILVNGAIYG